MLRWRALLLHTAIPFILHFPVAAIPTAASLRRVFIFRSIHIAMADQPDGQRFDHFFPEIPYTIFGGAWIDDGQTHKRWHSAFLNTREIPFSLLLVTLPLYLDHFHDYLSRITADHIFAYACTTSLGPNPNAD